MTTTMTHFHTIEPKITICAITLFNLLLENCDEYIFIMLANETSTAMRLKSLRFGLSNERILKYIFHVSG